MSVRGKSSRRKIIYALSFTLVLFLLVGGGWLVKNDAVLVIKRLGIDYQGPLRPTNKEGVKEKLERQLKELALKEGLRFMGTSMVEEKSLIATFSGQLTCLFDLEKDVSSQLASLQFVLWRSKIEGKKLREVDLRFDKPVVEYH